MELIKSLNWRYATKKYRNEKIPIEKVQQILDAISLSASSAGMQPYRVFSIENEDIRKQIGEGSFNAQIVESSHLLVFAAYTAVTAEQISNYIDHIATVRDTPAEGMVDFKKSLETYLLNRSDEENFSWAARQAYIALGTGIIAAAELRVDATPMEGFDQQKVDEVLGLKNKGLKSIVMLSLGYRDEENDYFAKLKKVRTPKEEFISVVA
ncbi:nitroreductase family protein [Niabella ginsengisoli]|uniref:Nitroreductase family protein n=1 Tax=Niabella ginsengisoli TaxID=522298 RepID=A0ABS9SRC2_9BACT|nr:nitroreductase family protein [Niabella ginsengisoli]MCH5600806.1 nitroreductase family protein [Niabella ginsengisoli]